MKTITLNIDEAVLERACRVAEARGTTVELLTSAALRMMSEWDSAADPIWSSVRDDAELEEQVLADIMQERARRWQP